MSMKEKTTKTPGEEMRDEYDLRNMTRGKYTGKDIRIVGATQPNPKASDEDEQDILDVRRALAEAKRKGTINARVLWRELNLRLQPKHQR
jgi:hypothetical protein